MHIGQLVKIRFSQAKGIIIDINFDFNKPYLVKFIHSLDKYRSNGLIVSADRFKKWRLKPINNYKA